MDNRSAGIDKMTGLTVDVLKREIQLGLDELDRGEVVDGPKYLQELLRRLDADVPVIRGRP